ncbi:hypothetical protein ABTZ58_07800 [Streptomyces sp. NPDC094143]|uniref:hypothetical protein n=1 Tax=Streptomyces sp. NPDC094143 TaxID=3155310 RepID=UPI00331848DF
MTVALHTRVRADRVAAYEAAHREVPREGTDTVRAAGAGSWRWQARPAELPDVAQDHTGAGADAGLPVVRELPA